MNNREKNENYLLLELKNAKKRDHGRNIIRIDRQSMQKLNVKTGDILEVFGKKMTAGIAFPSYPQDYDLDIIRIDPRMRKNIESEIGEMIKVRKATVKTAKFVVLAPLNILIRSNPRFELFVKRKLLNIPMSINDTIAISIGISKEILFKVINLEPQGICIIKQTTGLTINKHIAEKEKDITSFDMIGGLNEEIQQIKEIVEVYLIQSSVKKEIGMISPKGILLYGIPGTGKTLLAKAIAYESGINFISLNAAEPTRSRNRSMIDQIKYAFQQAKDLKPSIIFIDHIDAIAPNIERVVGKKEHVICSQLLSLIDGIDSEDDILIIGATNKPEILEPALLRSGRLNYL
ncbi:MAG: AAA family ATPase, partial [Candidatus Thorarchaeota archaeon]